VQWLDVYMAWVCLNGAEMVVTLETGSDNHLA